MTSLFKRLIWGKPTSVVLDDEPIDVIRSESNDINEESEDTDTNEEKAESENTDNTEDDKENEESEGSGESEENEDQTINRDTSTFMDDFYTDIFTSPQFRMLCNLYAGLVLLSISATTYNLLSSDTNICDKQFAPDSPATIIYIVFVNTPNLE